MSRNFTKISFCIPVYNESGNVINDLKYIKKGLDKIIGHNNYEIIIVDNGSSDDTFGKIIKLKSVGIKPYKINIRGIGAAYKKAIYASKFNNIVLSAIDLPFGFSDLQAVQSMDKKYDLIFGSKAHPLSKLSVPFKRIIYSYFYRLLLNTFFDLEIKDTQGSVFLKKSSVKKILRYCISDNAFFTAQLAIYGKYFYLKMTEIPVQMRVNYKRRSKFTLMKDGWKMFISIIQEHFKSNKLPATASPASESASRKTAAGKT